MKNAYKKICLSIISLVLITTLSLPIFAFSEEMPHVQPRNSDKTVGVPSQPASTLCETAPL